ncbi:MAG: cob(I)yrinic acid a,c-diamide adenosyltransferase [Nitrospira sp.]|nr:cob(I)yrinic acid a,c-diamide adenosyltransferase [bacterium]MBL7048576.1 cob(I)yrinic acid a,c-diamide adenosyltransferase [Nitrospira sp.]
MSKGLIHINTGEGKGKTTASFGLAVRAAGQGRRVLILQFLKSRTKSSGELNSAEKLGIKVIKFPDQTTPLFDPSVTLDDLEKSIESAVEESILMIRSGEYDLAVLDEFCTVLGGGYAGMAAAEKIISAKPEKMELIFTGRGAPAELISLADYVTEMKMIKHPYTRGIPARKGIEF